jgi:hypothetical protein
MSEQNEIFLDDLGSKTLIELILERDDLEDKIEGAQGVMLEELIERQMLVEREIAERPEGM